MRDKIILIYGLEPFLINKKIQEIVNNEEITSYDMSISSMEEVYEDVLSFSMFSTNKDIICTDCNFLASKSNYKDANEKDGLSMLEPNSSDKEKLDILLEILKKDIENRLILVVNSKVDQRKKAVKELLRIGTIYNFDKLKDYEITKFIEGEFKDLNYKIDNITLNYFYEFVGKNLDIIHNEITKLDLYKEDKVITIDDIDSISSRTIGDNIFDLIDAIVNKDVDKSMGIYDDFILLNQEELNLISMLAAQFRLIYQTKTMYNAGYTETDIIKQLDVHPYRIKLARTSSVNLIDAKMYLMKLFDLDVIIKTSKKDKSTAFKMFLLEM